jgi:choline-sulfatase
MTGKYVSRTGCYDNGGLIPADVPTLCHYLSIQGYDTVASGKMHFIGPDQLHGFEKRLNTDIYPTDFNWLPERPEGGFGDFSSFHINPMAIDHVTGGVRQWSMQFDYDEETQFRALEYLRSKRSQYTGSLQKELPPRDESPFFLCVSYTHPHEPLHVTQELWDLYEDKEIELPDIPENLAELEHPMDKQLNTFHGTHLVDLDDPQAQYNMRRAYYGLVTYIDRKVGELLQALEDLGLRENTMILFVSDHGDMLGDRRMIQKRVFYQFAARVPWIISYPPRWEGGQVINEPVSLVDVMPTILDFAAVDPEKILPIDGRSVIPLIEGERDPERVVFAEHHTEGITTTSFMVRQGDFKYIHTTGYSPRLFNLAEDPKEWNNLAGQPEYQQVEAKMHDLLVAKFDAEQIEADIQDSMARRELIKQAMRTTGLPKWDYQPFVDASQQYWREG